MISRRSALGYLSSLPLLGACAGKREIQSVQHYAKGRVEVFDPSFTKLVSPNATIELLADGFKWTEGPAWDSKRQHLYFSDIPNNRIHSWNRIKGLQTFLDPAGRDDVDIDADAAPGTNGILYLEEHDSLLICNQNGRSVDLLNITTGQREAIAHQFNRKSFNSPNDVVRANDGTLFFTDPPYGLKDQETFKGKEQPYFGVYRVAKNGHVSLISGDMTRPNGIALSPDNRTLYVSQSDVQAPIVQEFTLDKNGYAVSDKLFADYADLIAEDSPGLPDGMAVDKNGFLFITGPGGVIVMAPDGKRLGRIYTGRATANCTFGEDGSTLFMTAHDTLLSIPTLTHGFR